MLVPDTLLMTATITPPAGAAALKRSDPEQRLRDYAEALRFYLSLPGQQFARIVFIENSDSDVAPLRALDREGRVEFVSFYGLDYPPEYPRGYGEFRLLDYGFEHSEIIAALPDDARLWKVTGRYQVRNLARLAHTSPRRPWDLYCDLKDKPIRWMDTRVFGVTKRGYRDIFLGLYPELGEPLIGRSPEFYLRKRIGDMLDEKAIVPRFRIEPRVHGIRALDDARYERGRNLMLYTIRAAARRVAPWVWI